VTLSSSFHAALGSLCDDGPGFPPAFLDVAFERFTRGEESRTAPGAGLGLSIVRTIARAHGGEAYISNGDGGGAHASISIPDTPMGTPASVGEAAPSPAGPANVTAP
jgi:signal transduction histidine kinase